MLQAGPWGTDPARAHRRRVSGHAPLDVQLLLWGLQRSRPGQSRGPGALQVGRTQRPSQCAHVSVEGARFSTIRPRQARLMSLCMAAGLSRQRRLPPFKPAASPPPPPRSPKPIAGLARDGPRPPPLEKAFLRQLCQECFHTWGLDGKKKEEKRLNPPRWPCLCKQTCKCRACQASKRSLSSGNYRLPAAPPALTGAAPGLGSAARGLWERAAEARAR